jgi:hypothetical protein
MAADDRVTATMLDVLEARNSKRDKARGGRRGH